ncbi:MAG: PH domain-containing protein [Gemmatimonadetes bacterium]|nr:PH domain-containing protein [Gemmatimonadota bacterium]
MAPLALRPLDPRVIRLWRSAGLATTAVLVAAALVLELVDVFPGPAGAVPITIAAAGGLLSLLVPAARYRAWGFSIRERDVLIRRGLVWRTWSSVPHARIQHVDTRRGPLERWLGLAHVVVFTAGSYGAALTIPGLAAEEAEGLRDRLARLGGGEDAV